MPRSPGLYADFHLSLGPVLDYNQLLMIKCPPCTRAREARSGEKWTFLKGIIKVSLGFQTFLKRVKEYHWHLKLAEE